MSRSTTLEQLVAHYLFTSYPSALPAFLAATHLPNDGTTIPSEDLRTIYNDYLSHGLARDLQSTSITSDGASGVKQLMKIPLAPRVRIGEPERVWEVGGGNLLVVGVGVVGRRAFDTATAT